MSVEALEQLTRLDIPKSAGGISTSCQDLLIRIRVNTAGHVACVCSNSFLTSGHIFISCDRVDCDFVVQAAVGERLLLVLFVFTYLFLLVSYMLVTVSNGRFFM